MTEQKQTSQNVENAQQIMAKLISTVSKMCDEVDRMLDGDLDDVQHVKKMKIIIDSAYKLARVPNLLFGKVSNYEAKLANSLRHIMDDNIRLKKQVDNLRQNHIQRDYHQKMQVMQPAMG